MEQPLHDIRCPDCSRPVRRTGSAPKAGFGILRCDCASRALLDGIVVSIPAGTSGPHARAVRALERGKPEDALAEMLAPSLTTRAARLVHALARRGLPIPAPIRGVVRAQARDTVVRGGSLSFARAARLIRNATYADYLVQRFANPSFHGAIPVIALASLLPAGARIVDLAGGAGHASFLLSRLAPHLGITLVDNDFANLYLARRRTAPGVRCVLADGNAPLPFADASFDAAFCLDALHYVERKDLLVSEATRVLTPGGAWLFAHLHNALADNLSPGMPLSPEQWRELFRGIDGDLVAEDTLLRSLAAPGKLDLRSSEPDEHLRRSRALAFLAGPAGLFRREHDVLGVFLNAPGPLGLNPIYGELPATAPARLRKRWPNSFLQGECEMDGPRFPDEIELDAATHEYLARGQHSGARPPETVRELRNKLIVVPLPERFLAD